MARLPRLDLPGIPQHIVQRGNDRQACFADAADYLRYRQELGEAALRYDCALHAYVLMTNHVHLLTTPREPGGVSRMMQAIGRRYVGSFNARYRRTGTLWEGRFKSALVDSEHYVLACYRYIELNPVRAGIVTSPREYRWSSHARNAHGTHEQKVKGRPHTNCVCDSRRSVRGIKQLISLGRLQIRGSIDHPSTTRYCQSSRRRATPSFPGD